MAKPPKLPSAHHGVARPHLRARHLTLKGNGAYGSLKGGSDASAFGDPNGGGSAFPSAPGGDGLGGGGGGGMPAGTSAPAQAPLPAGE